MKIIYKNTDNTVSVITPSADALNQYTIKQIAEKDVPAGLAYKIVDDVPSDRTFRNAWEVDDADLTDGVGNKSNDWG